MEKTTKKEDGEDPMRKAQDEEQREAVKKQHEMVEKQEGKGKTTEE